MESAGVLINHKSVTERSEGSLSVFTSAVRQKHEENSMISVIYTSLIIFVHFVEYCHVWLTADFRSDHMSDIHLLYTSRSMMRLCCVDDNRGEMEKREEILLSLAIACSFVSQMFGLLDIQQTSATYRYAVPNLLGLFYKQFTHIPVIVHGSALWSASDVGLFVCDLSKLLLHCPIIPKEWKDLEKELGELFRNIIGDKET